MSDQLKKDFLSAINSVSFYNAAEGNYSQERVEREKAYQRLKTIKAEMVSLYGREETRRVANSQPHLCFWELQDLSE